MNMHTKEPWEAFIADKTTAVIAGGKEIIRWTGFDDCSIPKKRHRANARRIVACVNALAGIPTEALEAGVIGEAVDTLRECELDLACYENDRRFPAKAQTLARVRAALAKLKGVRS